MFELFKRKKTELPLPKKAIPMPQIDELETSKRAEDILKKYNEFMDGIAKISKDLSEDLNADLDVVIKHLLVGIDSKLSYNEHITKIEYETMIDNIKTNDELVYMPSNDIIKDIKDRINKIEKGLT